MQPSIEGKTDKEIKDYLHFYLGCECLVQFMEDRDGVTCVLTSVTEECASFNGSAPDYYFDEPECGCKPILRRLSSMTEEEANAWFDFHYRDNSVFAWRNCYEVNRTGAEFWINYHSSKRDRRRVIKFDELTAHDFQYLLSHGFDLFDLIDSGLALEKETTHDKTVK